MKFLFTAVFVVTFVFSSLAGDKDNKTENNSEKKEYTITLSGSVTDKQTGETLVGVEVKLDGTDQKAYTDFDGNFTFNKIKPGTYNISASYISYQKSEMKNQNIDVLSNNVALKLTPVN